MTSGSRTSWSPHPRRIEDGEIGGESLAQLPAIFQARIFAGSDVIFRTASGSVSTFSSRT